MITQDSFEKVVETAKRVATEAFEEGLDFSNAVGVWHDGALYAWIFPGGDRDDLLRIIRMVVVSAGADAVTCALDTYTSDSLTKKDGSDWEKGEMERAVKEKTEDADLVTDSLLVSYYDRLGNNSSTFMPYKKDGSKVVWSESKTLDGGCMEGVIPEAVGSFFTEKTTLDDLKDLPEDEKDVMVPGTSTSVRDLLRASEAYPAEAFAHRLAAAIYVVLPQITKGAMVMATDDPNISSIFTRLFGKGMSVADLEEDND